ncbi:BTAD domain-containing putative transcriptional regulator [Nonomuraea sp. NPDC050227]|uniref:AfsR/SARP family transcriptional regulator n=1 Tax=Nonomuraea sp. NPDC050227 TaxID=3364360 RepID=UPI0037BD0269
MNTASTDSWPVLGGAAAFALLVMLLTGLLVHWARRRGRPNVPLIAVPGVDIRREDGLVPGRELITATVGAATVSTGTQEEASAQELPSRRETAAAASLISEPASGAIGPPTVAGSAALAQVYVLGPARVMVAGREVSFGRAEGRALFALLATIKDGASSESVVERLWPGDEERGARRLDTAVRDINATMRQATGLAAHVKFVVKTGQRRRLPAAYFDVDWWQFEEAYVQANSASGEHARREALRRMLDLYQGPLLADRDDTWCISPRQAAATQAVRGALRLVDLERPENPDRALDVLTLAVDRIDPYNEVLWRQILTIQGDLGRLSAFEVTFQQLTERLAEIDARPSAQARQIYQRFIG